MCDAPSLARGGVLAPESIPLISRGLQLLSSDSFLSDESVAAVTKCAALLAGLKVQLASCASVDLGAAGSLANALALAGGALARRFAAGDLRLAPAAASLQSAGALAPLPGGVDVGLAWFAPPTPSALVAWLADPQKPSFVPTTFAHVDFLARVANLASNPLDARARAAQLAIVCGSQLASLAAFRASVPRLCGLLDDLSKSVVSGRLTDGATLVALLKSNGPEAFCSLAEQVRSVFLEVHTYLALLLCAPIFELPFASVPLAAKFSPKAYAPRGDSVFVAAPYSLRTAGSALELALVFNDLPRPSLLATLDNIVAKVSPAAWAKYAAGQVDAPGLVAQLDTKTFWRSLSAAFDNVRQFADSLSRDLKLVPQLLGPLGDPSGSDGWIAAPPPGASGDASAALTVCGQWSLIPSAKTDQSGRPVPPWVAAPACPAGSGAPAWESSAGTPGAIAALLASSLNPVTASSSAADADLLASQQARTPTRTPLFTSRYVSVAPACGSRLAPLVNVIALAVGSDDPSVRLAGSASALAAARSKSAQQWLNGNGARVVNSANVVADDSREPGFYWRLLAEVLAPSAQQVASDAEVQLVLAARPALPPPPLPRSSMLAALFLAGTAIFALILLLALLARRAIGVAVDRFVVVAPAGARVALA